MNDGKVEGSAVPHNLIMEQRNKLMLSGVTEVLTFEEDCVTMKTTKGDLTVRGSGMRMDSYTAEVCDLTMHGDVYAIVYTNDTGKKEGFFSRVFK